MSGRGGRGGRGRGGLVLKGATFEYDKDAKLDDKPNELFPKHPNLVKPRAPTDTEARILRNHLAVQSTVHFGPLYTDPTRRDPDAPALTFSEDQFNKQYGVNSKADFDPFSAADKYTKKFIRPKRTLPDLKNGVKLDKDMFPEELWDVLGGESGEKIKADIAKAQAKKANFLDAMNRAMATSADKEDTKTSTILDRLAEEEEREGEDDDDSDAADEEPQDDDFEDDEDGGDYDAEQYFNDGEGDDDLDGDGGGDDY
ncbi:DNA-directed RNA polymerase III, subunit Rpc31 [Bisporella sp. PMI_857]|nr:DNA-directed RNA polymerase III, subunit Rpc31 [Bisporella sp. PMI_857]